MTADLRLGDCLDVMRGLPAQSVDAVITDPPYNVGLSYECHQDSMDAGAYLAWCRSWFTECRRVARECVVLTPGRVNLPMWLSDIERTDSVIVWSIPNCCSRNYIGKKRGFRTWEPIVVYGKAGGCVVRDLITVSISHQKDAEGHPCPKPLKLLEALVPQIVNAGGSVLDPFMGSGTTGVACVRAGRDFMGIEISPAYYEIAARRIREAEAMAV